MALDARHPDRRPPKTAELVAAHIRRLIVRGELQEGGSLPSEHELMAQFGVSRPTLREALRVLEWEGLIVIRRGAKGGARVQVPTGDAAARHAGFILQYQGATLADVLEARTIIEAPTARVVASRPDRSLAARRLQAALDCQADDLANVEHAPDFHRELVRLTGNDTLALTIGLLESISDAATVRATADLPLEQRMAVGRTSHQAHARLLELIRAGDGDAAEAFWRKHLTASAALLLELNGGGQTVLDLLS